MDQNCEAAEMRVDSLASFPQAMFVDVVHQSCSDVIRNNGPYLASWTIAS